MYDAYENRRDRFDRRLAQAVDRQEYVRYDDDAGLLYCWNGSLTVNVYALNGECVDMWTLGLTGDEDRDTKREEAITSIADRMQEAEE